MAKENHQEVMEKLKKYFYYFLVFSFLGWIWEIIVCLINGEGLVNPGVLRGPWVPIYGFGMVTIIVIARWVKQWWKLFLVAFFVSGVFEYVTAVVLETLYGVRWWDYTDFLLDFQGRICVEVMVVFAALACLLYYFVVPVFDRLYERMRGRMLDFIMMICLIGLMVDMGYMLVLGPNVDHTFMV